VSPLQVVTTAVNQATIDDLADFAALIERHQRHVYVVALATVNDHVLAEDVVQETFLVAYARRHQIRDRDAVRAWLAAIARNRGRDLLRARRREVLVEEPQRLEIACSETSVEERLGCARLREDVRRALARVPPRYREVLMLYYAHGRSADSIAADLGLTPATTLQRLARGRKLVRDHSPELAGYVEQRASRSFVTAIVALLLARAGRAEAAVRSRPRASRAAVAASVVGLVLLTGFVDRGAPSAAPIVPPLHAITEHPKHVASPIEPTVARAPRRSIALPPRAVATVSPHASPPATIATPPPPPKRMAIVDPQFDDGPRPCPCDSVPPPRPSRRPVAWQPTNALVENAALPEPGAIDYESIGLGMFLRVGLSRHVAVHAAMVGLDTQVGSSSNAEPGFGGGIKIGGDLTRKWRAAVIVEGAHGIEKSLDLGRAWIAREYAALSYGTARENATLFAGAIQRFDGTERVSAPFIGWASLHAWDDNLAFVLETTIFPKRTIDGANLVGVTAVRFRDQRDEAMLLGLHRVHVDVGALTAIGEDKLSFVPWVQAGLGW